MLWTIFVILLVLWLLGLVSSYTMGGFIHILLVLAVIVLIINLVSGRIEAVDGADALVRLLDRPDFQLKLSLSGLRPNGSVTVAIRPEDGQTFFSWNKREWGENYRETDSKFPAAPLNATSVATRTLWTAGPAIWPIAALSPASPPKVIW